MRKMFDDLVDELGEIGGSSLDVDRDVVGLVVDSACDLGKPPGNTFNRVAKTDSLHPAEETDDPAFQHRVGLLVRCRVYETYGASEYAPIAAGYAAGRRRLVEDRGLIEIR
jgi:hypothetical protein